MISLGLVDIVLIILLLAAIFYASRRRGLGLSLLVILIIAVIMIERLAPGALARVGEAIRGLDAINAAGPHLTIAPIVTFR